MSAKRAARGRSRSWRPRAARGLGERVTDRKTGDRDQQRDGNRAGVGGCPESRDSRSHANPVAGAGDPRGRL